MTESATKTYRGQLTNASNGEENDLVGLLEEGAGQRDKPTILADELQEDIEKLGRYLTVRYFTADVPVSEEELDMALANLVVGLGEAVYGMDYSEISGYLWTDQELNVRGHVLLK